MKVLEAFGEPIADGGQEAFVFGVLDKMDMTGLDIDCLTAYDCRSEYYKALVERKGGRVYALNLPFAPGKSRNNIARPFRAFLKEHHYDVVHIHSGSISVLAIMAAVADKAGVKKVIVHSHATGEADSLKHKALRWVASLSMRRHVDIYCACSRMAADWKFEPEFARKALIIKNGVDTSRFAYNPEIRKAVREKLGLNDQAYVLGHVGRFSPEKNQEFILSIFQALLAQDTNARLILVGDGEKKKQIEQMTVQKGLKGKVIFTGSVKNVNDYLQAMDVFVLPSLFEGLGIVAIEAQAAGLPVVASTNVPMDIAISKDVEFLNLNDSSERWVQKIISLKSKKRTDGIGSVIDAGYDIVAITMQIKEMYLREGK